jgi:hypothetical protein
VISLQEFLENQDKRSRLSDIILAEKYQKDLFEKNKFDSCLDDLFYSIKQRKPLYQTWTQDINGKKRCLSVPNKPLKELINDYILYFIKKKEVHETCHGGEKEWSVKRSLETHLPCLSALSFDLKSAFENIPFKIVYDFFYGLLPEYISYSDKEEISRFFSLLSTVRYINKRGLPQGSPISVFIFNRCLYNLDKELTQKSNERDLRYSRWVDDFTISSKGNKGIEYFLGAIELVNRFFEISKEKIYFQNGNDIYLLGHKINYSLILKNTKEEKLRNKSLPINFNEWFGENKIKNYELWN